MWRGLQLYSSRTVEASAAAAVTRATKPTMTTATATSAAVSEEGPASQTQQQQQRQRRRWQQHSAQTQETGQRGRSFCPASCVSHERKLGPGQQGDDESHMSNSGLLAEPIAAAQTGMSEGGHSTIHCHHNTARGNRVTISAVSPAPVAAGAAAVVSVVVTASAVARGLFLAAAPIAAAFAGRAVSAASVAFVNLPGRTTGNMTVHLRRLLPPPHSSFSAYVPPEPSSLTIAKRAFSSTATRYHHPRVAAVKPTSPKLSQRPSKSPPSSKVKLRPAHFNSSTSPSSPSPRLFAPAPLSAVSSMSAAAGKKSVVVVDGLDGENPIKRDRHPVWYPPKQDDGKGLRVMNSLTETVETFSPKSGRLVRWYTCGPTVYDLSHMGHARAYLTFDIIRRIMEDYFNYSVIYQMNITDIDDKIIKRARINKLLDDFRHDRLKGSDVAQLMAFTKEAVATAEKALAKRKEHLSAPLPETASGRQRGEREEKLLELQLKETQLAETVEKIAAAEATKDFDQIFKAASGVNGDLLDELEGSKVTDQQIFEDHARKYEREFFDDCARLGIREPDVVTRVTEYVPQVVAFVQKIIDNGFAYKGETSIFFDTEAYIKAGHDYPKLKTGGDKETTEDEMAEGEGALSKGIEGEKRSANDFALWKFSKPGEPRWPSPWGEGRPGWHIECSVMASDLLGENMDIHGGGWDLKFPHHDNECAQSEACNLHHQWVNYFLHCGHLHIKGLKMSKSLKNFITIRQALDELGVTPRTMRLLFLANPWNRPMNFSDQSLDDAKEKDRVLRAFFGSVDIVLRSDYWAGTQGANTADRELLEKWAATEQNVHEALQNNFDTPTALQALMDLVSATNAYMAKPERTSATLLRKVARYITKMFQIFGVVEGTDSIGLAHDAGAASGEDRLVPVVDTLVRFRDAVRATAKEHKVMPPFLALCDEVRDEWLVDSGIRLEDNPAGPTTWKKDDPALLRRELEDRRAAEEAGRKKKLANLIDAKSKAVEKWTQYNYPPTEYFARQDAERPEGEKKFAAFDPETGLPTKLTTGEEVTEKEAKKYSKEVAKYQKVYDDFISKGGEPWLKEQKDELAALLEEAKR